MIKKEKNDNPTSNPLLLNEDGQFEKLEEKKKFKKDSKSLFGVDVNDPSERGYD